MVRNMGIESMMNSQEGINEISNIKDKIIRKTLPRVFQSREEAIAELSKSENAAFAAYLDMGDRYPAEFP